MTNKKIILIVSIIAVLYITALYCDSKIVYAVEVEAQTTLSEHQLMLKEVNDIIKIESMIERAKANTYELMDMRDELLRGLLDNDGAIEHYELNRVK